MYRMLKVAVIDVVYKINFSLPFTVQKIEIIKTSESGEE